MTGDNEIFKNALKNSGLSNTKSRRQLFNIFVNSGHKPLSPAEIVNFSNETMDRSTIYRNLETFQKLNIIRPVSIGWKIKYELSEEFHGHHHHMTCIKCGKITTIHDDTDIDLAIKNLSAKRGFQAIEHTLDIRGYCNTCQNFKNPG